MVKVAFILNAQKVTWSSDSLESLRKQFEQLKIYKNNDLFFDTILKKETFLTKIDIDIEESNLVVLKTIRYRHSKGIGGQLEKYNIPISGIHHIDLMIDSIPNSYEKEFFRASLNIISNNAKKFFTIETIPIEEGKSRIEDRSVIELFTFIKGDLKFLKRIITLLEYIRAGIVSNSVQSIQKQIQYPTMINGNLVYFIAEVDVPPIFPPAKDIFESRALLNSFVRANLTLDSLTLSNTKMTIVVSSEGKVIDVLFVDEYFEGIKEDVEALDKQQKKEYLYFKETHMGKDPNKEIKGKIKKNLFLMPNWIPATINGKPVNTWII